MYALLVLQGKLISGASDRCIRDWDARSFVCEHVLLELSATILSVAFASGHLFAGCQDGRLAVWRRGAGAGFEVLCAVPAHKGGIYATLGVEEQVKLCVHFCKTFANNLITFSGECCHD